jgi:uncharacterized protein YkwD
MVLRRRITNYLRRGAALATAIASVSILSAAPAAPLVSNPTAFATVAPVVGMAATASGNGYWQVGADGAIFATGDAPFLGSLGGMRLNRPIVGMAATPTGRGYWMVASDGGIFSFGNAGFHGSTGGMRLNQPIVGMAGTPTGRGYWLVASDGGIFSFGDARFYGSTGGMRLNRPIVGVAATPTGRGYWMVASDGGIFSFGDAGFYGSTGGIRLNRPIVDMASAPNGRGYMLAAEDGGVFLFGSAPFYGSASGACPTAAAAGVAMSRTSPGYWITFGDARTYAFSPGSTPPSCASVDRANAAAQDFYSRLNAERAARGRPGLAWDGGLAAYATNWSRTMAHSGFRHSTLGNMWSVGSYNMIGENIAMGTGATAGTLHVAWMHSSGHRQNMLSPSFDVVGVGVYCAPDGTMWATTSFAHRSAAGPAPSMGGIPPTNPIARGDAGSSRC